MVTFAAQCGLWFLGYLKITSVLVGLETTLPTGERQFLRRLGGLPYALVGTAASTLVAVTFALVWPTLGFTPLIRVDILHLYHGPGPALRAAWLVMAAILGAAVVDLAFYAWHRFQHRFLWPIHAVHHSADDLSALSNYHHVSDELIRTFVVAIPFAILFDVRAGPVITMMGGIQGAFIHSSTRLNFGPLRWLIGDNRFHRIHHSTEPRHWGKNYAAFFPLWDVLFGTAYFPDPKEWPQTGVPDAPPPSSLRDFICRPFLRPGGTTYP